MSLARRRGFSLLEALLACALFLLVADLVMQVLLPMAPGLIRGSQQAGLQQLSCLAVERLAQQLEQTTPNGLELLPTGPGELPVRLALRPLTGVGAGGAQNFAASATLYWWDPAAQRLWSSTWQAPPWNGSMLTIQSLPASSDFDAVIATPPSLARVLASGVTQMQVTLIPGGSGPLTEVDFSLSLQAPSPDNKPSELFSIQRNVVLRNMDYLP